MNLHNLVSSLVAFLLLAAFGAIVFALAHFASRGAFSPDVKDDAAPGEIAPEEATPDEATAPVQPAAHTRTTCPRHWIPDCARVPSTSTCTPLARFCCSAGRSTGEEPLGEGSNEDDFDKQANCGFHGANSCRPIGQRQPSSEEDPTMEGGHAQDQRRILASEALSCQPEVSEQRVHAGEGSNDYKIGEEGAERTVSVARDEIEEPRADGTEVVTLQAKNAALEKLSPV